MRTVTDVFKCKGEPLDNIFASNINGDIELQVETSGELGIVILTKKQASELAGQILEMVMKREL